MGDDHDGLAEPFAQVEEQAVDLVAVVRVEVARGFVGQQHGGRIDQRTGDGHALLLAARKLSGLVVAPRREAHHVEQFGGTAFDIGARTPADQPRNADVLESRELRKQVVELEHEADALVAELRQGPIAQGRDIAAVDLHAPAVGTRQRADDLQKRGLASAAGPHDGDHLALRHVERNAFQHLQRAETLVYVGNSYHRRNILNSLTVSTASRTSWTRSIAAPWRRHSQPRATVPASDSAGVASRTL